MSVVLTWLTGSGVIQGAIIGATFAFLTAILILNAISRRETETVNGWRIVRKAGKPGLGRLTAAAMQKALPVVNVIEEAAYWTASTDGSGRKLNGKINYSLHFASGELPPTKAFWSLAATDSAGYLVRNPAGRRSGIDSHSGLRLNPDGSADILLQSEEPAADAGNWLPTPRGRFILIARAYLPDAAILTGTYNLPPIRSSALEGGTN